MSAASQFLGRTRVWVSGTTYLIGDIVLSPADGYQSYVRVIAGGGTTDPSADSTNWKPVVAKAVKSVQRGSATFAASTGYSTGLAVTVASINTGKSILRVLHPGTRASLDEDVFPEIVSATSIKFYRGVSSRATAQTFTWELVEYY